VSYKVELIINTGSFQHVALTIEGANKSQFMTNLADFNDADKAKLGVFMAELESHVKVAHQEALSGASVEPAEALVKGILGGRVVEVHEPGESLADALSEAGVTVDDMKAAQSWSAPVERSPKPWENQDTAPRAVASNSLFD